MSMEVRIRKKVSRDFTLEVDIHKGGQALALLGPSGSGKSMTLMCIAGVETPDEGYIAVNGSVLYDSVAGVDIKPANRGVGYLFQEYALFPRMTVEQNIACSLPKRERSAVSALISRFDLTGLERRLPCELSGGQRQRTAIARMLARAPEVLLLDEPFSALDGHLREQVQTELSGLLHGRQEVIMVTHNRAEAYRLCPELAILEHGRVVAAGETKAVFDRPATLAAARLTGCKNFSRAVSRSDGGIDAPDWGVTLSAETPHPGGAVWVGIRAHDIEPCSDAPTGENTFPIQPAELWEDLFEWNLLCRTADGVEPIWMKIPKSRFSGVPTHVCFPPSALFLMRDNLK